MPPYFAASIFNSVKNMWLNSRRSWFHFLNFKCVRWIQEINETEAAKAIAVQAKFFNLANAMSDCSLLRIILQLTIFDFSKYWLMQNFRYSDWLEWTVVGAINWRVLIAKRKKRFTNCKLKLKLENQALIKLHSSNQSNLICASHGISWIVGWIESLIGLMLLKFKFRLIN